jgi:glycerol-3-phosphate acyltransferase PlsX
MTPPRPLTIAIDAMGGDLGPEEVVRGVIQAAIKHAGTTNFIIVGDEKIIQSELSRHKAVPSTVRVRHASQTIEMTDKPREVYRRKPDASVVVSARLVKDKEADAFISIGNTGAAMAASVFLLRPIPGIDRPAIAAPLPSKSGKVVILLDAGANVDCEEHQLVQFAIMGQCYSERVLGTKEPTVALLNIGEEEAKGNELTKNVHKMLKGRIKGFLGNIEGRQVFAGVVDVVVCDGFAGNIVLKTGEGVAEMVVALLKEELTRHKWMKPFLLLFRKAMLRLKNRIDYREFGGAPLLGVNGVCIIGHGRSDAVAIVNACRVAERSVVNNLVGEIARIAATLKLPPVPPSEESV